MNHEPSRRVAPPGGAALGLGGAALAPKRKSFGWWGTHVLAVRLVTVELRALEKWRYRYRWRRHALSCLRDKRRKQARHGKGAGRAQAQGALIDECNE